jgi:hypothetical protein
MDPVQAPVCRPSHDRVATQAGRKELRAADQAVLERRKLRDLRIQMRPPVPPTPAR